MNSRMFARVLMAAVLTLSAGAAMAATRSDADLAKSVRHEILMYSRYTIWDDINFRVDNGSVELLGAVSQPFKKSDLGHIVARIPGVTAVTNQLRVLPVSFMDDRLRLQVARAIYGNSALSRYGIQPNPPIHIIVENGHVSLHGVVLNDLEKQVAGMRAATAGLSFGPVVNNLVVEHPSRKS